MNLIQSVLSFIPGLLGLGPYALAFLGAIVVTCTTLQALVVVIAKMFPSTSPVGHALGTFAFDLSKIANGVRVVIAFLSKYAKGTAIGGLILLTLALTGCARPFVWSSPSTQAVTCEITSAVLPLLEELAATLGFPLSVIEDLYGTACNTAAAKGMTQHDAEQFGLAEAKRLGFAMKARGMRAVSP